MLFTACGTGGSPDSGVAAGDSNKVESPGPEASQAQVSGNALMSLAACRGLAETTWQTLTLQGGDGVDVSGYYDRQGDRCLIRKRYAFPAGNPMAGSVELALYPSSSEDDWLAKCSDIAGTCKLGDNEIVLSGGRDVAFAETERYIAKLVANMEVAFRDEAAEAARAAREGEAYAESAAAEAEQAARDLAADDLTLSDDELIQSEAPN